RPQIEKLHHPALAFERYVFPDDRSNAGAVQIGHTVEVDEDVHSAAVDQSVDVLTKIDFAVVEDEPSHQIEDRHAADDAFLNLHVQSPERVWAEGLANRKNFFEIVSRPWDDVHADEFSDAARGCGAGVRGGLYRSDVAPHDGRHEAGVDFLPADED